MIDWPFYFKNVKKIIRDFPVPYVTRLSNSLSDENARSFAILISTLISLRTKDQVTEDASERILKKHTQAKIYIEITDL